MTSLPPPIAHVILTIVTAMSALLYRPTPDLPVNEARVEAVATPTPKVSAGRQRLARGWATYYAYHRGQAAAGPALRRALGARWRGKRVTVCADGTCLRVRLTDWCACGDRHGDPTIIDLDSRDFARLASLGTGILKVRVTR